MRRLKRDRDKPIPKSDLDQVAKFRAELGVYAKLKQQGATHRKAMLLVWGDGRPVPTKGER
jgi:hypothetical protein